MMKGNRGANVSNVAISLSESEHVANFQKKVTTWYLGNHRDLPWRKKDTSPYGIWVSEVMSQQTRIHTVIPYWIKWMKRFPTVQDLAKASIQDVHESWTGLGYYRRATALHEGAKYLVQVYNGAVPNAVEELIKVPGIGPYTAAAIASMAFEQPNAAVDGNVLRVYSRIMGLKDCDLSTRSVQKSIQEKAQQCMDTFKASIWNQAIMELGATICTSQTQPLCSQCPAQLYCAAYELCARGAIPAISGVIPKVSKKKIEKREEKTTALVIICNDHTVLMERRPPGGLLEHLWCFPMRNEFIKQESSMTAFIKQYVPDYSSTARKWKEKAFFCGTLVHIFSHIRLEVAVHMVNISEIPTIKTSKEMNEIQIDDELDSKQRKRKRGVSSRVRQNSAKDDSPSNSSGSVNSIQWVAITEVANQATSTLAKKILTQARSCLKVRR